MKVLIVYLILGLCLFSSCFFTSKKGFTIYREDISLVNSILLIQGVYCDNSGSCFFLYQNGLVKNAYVKDTIKDGYYRKNTKYDKDVFLSGSIFTIEYDLTQKELWGTYSVNNDSTIIIQTFTNCADCSLKRMVDEKKGKILNDSTLLLNPTFSYYDKKFYTDENVAVYKFVETKIKPDSTRAWFLKKHWYKKNLHPSRK